jgi:hypothetical protein
MDAPAASLLQSILLAQLTVARRKEVLREEDEDVLAVETSAVPPDSP